MQIREIVVATELSPSDEEGYRHAAAFAAAAGSPITLLNIDEVSRYGFRSSRQLTSYLDQVETERGRRFEAAAARLRSLGAREIKLLTLAGEAAEEIASYARAQGAALVIAGTSGARGPGRVVLGHTAKRLLRRCEVPLLLLPARPGQHGEEAAPAPRYRRLLAATDFSEPSERGLRATVLLAERLDAEVDYVHVIRLPIPVPAIPSEPPLLVPQESSDELRHARAEELQHAVDRLGTRRCTPNVTIGVNVPESLVEVARALGDELIALPSHSHGRLREALFGTTAEQVVKLSPVPVLIFPVPWLARNAPLPGETSGVG